MRQEDGLSVGVLPQAYTVQMGAPQPQYFAQPPPNMVIPVLPQLAYYYLFAAIFLFFFYIILFYFIYFILLTKIGNFIFL